MTFIELQIKNIDELLEGMSKLLDESDIRYSAIPGVFDLSGNYTVSIHKTADIFQLQSKLFKDFTHLFGILEMIIDHESKEVKKIFAFFNFLRLAGDCSGCIVKIFVIVI